MTTEVVAAYYHQATLDPEQQHRRVLDAKKLVKDLEFDAIAMQGLSGYTIGMPLAYLMRKMPVAVRKPIEIDRNQATYNTGLSHSSFLVEGGTETCKYVIVDDQISSGRTVKRMLKAMAEHRPGSECVGVLLYADYGYNEQYHSKQLGVPIYCLLQRDV